MRTVIVQVILFCKLYITFVEQVCELKDYVVSSYRGPIIKPRDCYQSISDIRSNFQLYCRTAVASGQKQALMRFCAVSFIIVIWSIVIRSLGTMKLEVRRIQERALFLRETFPVSWRPFQLHQNRCTSMSSTSSGIKCNRCIYGQPRINRIPK